MTGANYLKTFQPKEKIKASDTNDNNQYLLDQIRENAVLLQQYLENEVAKLQGSFIQPGFIVGLPFATIPVGYLKCDGSEVLIEDYPDLYEAIGTIYGQSDSTSFKLPDFQGKFLRGFGGNAASLGTVQANGAPNITGTATIGRGGYGSGTGAFSGTTSSGGEWAGGSDGKGTVRINFNASQSSAVYQDGLSEIRPENMSVIWVIKY